VVDSKNFPVAKAIAAALVTVRPGGLREMHWHPNADEWLYIISGKARITLFAAVGKARTMDFNAILNEKICVNFPENRIKACFLC